MRRQFTFTLLALSLVMVCFSQSSFSEVTCKVGDAAACGSKQVCMNGSPTAVCKTVPDEAPIDFILPFYSNSEVVCTHSHGIGSHSWPNAYYALDLATPYESSSDIIVAAADGKAFVFGDEGGVPCSQPQGSPAHAQTDKCGNGWGNHVKILHRGGYYSFYVHLEKIFAKNGQFVKKGEPIGLEGWTGLAGHRHLHWSIQKVEGRNESEWENHISWDGISVPFHFLANYEQKIQTVNAAEINCPHANIGEAPAEQQPRFKGIAERGPASESASSEFKLPSRELRSKLFDEFRSTIERLDGDGFIPRKNRPESWKKTTDNLKRQFISAKTPFEMGQVLKRLDQTYPNIHASISLSKDIDFEGVEGRVKPGIAFQPEIVSENQKETRYRITNVNKSLFLNLEPDSRPQYGDELLSLNGRSMKKWSEENFLFCKYPLREQCEIDFWDAFRKEYRSWNRRMPLIAELKRGKKVWKTTIPIAGQVAQSNTNPEATPPACGVDPKVYAPFKLVYQGENACAYEDDNHKGHVLLRIKSFNYRGSNLKIKGIREETKLFWEKYWSRKSAETKKLIIDVSDNGGGDSVVSWYRLFFSAPFQEQYAQFRNIDELKTDHDVRAALFYDEKAKEIFFENLKKEGLLNKLGRQDFLPAVPQFCATEDEDCREKLFVPIENKFKGEVRIVLNQWCHSSCVGFVWNMKNVLNDRVKFIGQPDDGDSTYGRVLVSVRIDQSSPKGFALTIGPRKSGQRAEAKDGVLFEQSVSVTRSTDRSGNIISGIPQKVDLWVPSKWDLSWDEWQQEAVKQAINY